MYQAIDRVTANIAKLSPFRSYSCSQFVRPVEPKKVQKYYTFLYLPKERLPSTNKMIIASKECLAKQNSNLRKKRTYFGWPARCSKTRPIFPALFDWSSSSYYGPSDSTVAWRAVETVSLWHYRSGSGSRRQRQIVPVDTVIITFQRVLKTNARTTCGQRKITLIAWNNCDSPSWSNGFLRHYIFV